MSSKEVGIEEARKVLGDLVTAAQQGTDIILTRNRRPAARITRYQEDTMTTTATILRNDDNETVTIAVDGPEVRVTFATDGQVVDDRVVYSAAGRASEASAEDEYDAAMEHAARLAEEKRQDGWR